jgi:hypothetical protein
MLLVVIALFAAFFGWFRWNYVRWSDRHLILAIHGVLFSNPSGLPQKSLPWLFRMFGTQPSKVVFVDPMLSDELFRRAVASFPEADVRRATKEEADDYTDRYTHYEKVVSVYYLERTDPVAAAQAIQAMFGSKAQAIAAPPWQAREPMLPDWKAKRLSVEALPKDQAAIAAILQKLDSKQEATAEK